MSKKRPTILVCNDDGVGGRGLAPLVEALRPLGRVVVVVPDREQSTMSHGMTLTRPLHLQEREPDFYTLDGRPVDCARLGVLQVLAGKCDLLVSGINEGVNLGQDVIYSGTVAAAREGLIVGVPGIAVSQDISNGHHYGPSAVFAAELAAKVLAEGLPPGVLLNVNAPALPRELIKGVKVGPLGKRDYGKDVTPHQDPRGRTFYWMGGAPKKGVAAMGTDVHWHEDGWITVAPVRLDQTADAELARFKAWF